MHYKSFSWTANVFIRWKLNVKYLVRVWLYHQNHVQVKKVKEQKSSLTDCKFPIWMAPSNKSFLHLQANAYKCSSHKHFIGRNIAIHSSKAYTLYYKTLADSSHQKQLIVLYACICCYKSRGLISWTVTHNGCAHLWRRVHVYIPLVMWPMLLFSCLTVGNNVTCSTLIN